MKKSDRRIDRTKLAITSAFIELLSHKSFDKITVNDIAEIANINRSTFYLHYEDKFALIKQIINEHLEKIDLYTDPFHTDSDAITINNAFTQIFEFLEGDFQFYAILLKSDCWPFFHKYLRELIMKLIIDANNSNISNDDKNEEFNILIKTSAIIGIIEWWISNDMPLTAGEMADNMLDIFVKLDA